ncbi:hypothetical protein [Roseobacter weihaiensis]|uniref:hypothetical protein n=1 Tax=Roseobacter weihaiensis TaxID=2763262 RepID=UPI001D0B1F79|nr:hypothetical protein [Roseobacter sp. H9]
MGSFAAFFIAALGVVGIVGAFILGGIIDVILSAFGVPKFVFPIVLLCLGALAIWGERR